MLRILACLLALTLGGCAASGNAGSLADLTIVDRSTGQRLQTYHHKGRHWIAGTPGNKYAVSINNKSGERVMTVVSVDGINVVSGETAAPGQNGYVLEGYMNYEINGWRKSTREVAAFVFTALPDSYAARTDRPDNVGVIGLAVFREWNPPQPAPHPQISAQPRSPPHAGSSADASPAAKATESRQTEQASETIASSASADRALPRRDERLGTGHGDREDSRVSYTRFRRASDRPSERLTLYYDSYANLLARGIIPPLAIPFHTPSPFPADTRFVPDPRG